MKPFSDALAFHVFSDPRDFLGDDGKPTPEWEAQHLIYVRLPAPLPASWNRFLRISRLKVHRLVAPHLDLALRAIHKKPDVWATINDCGGCYEFRAQRNTKDSLSRHALAIAIDLDVRDNPFLGLIPRVHKEVRAIMQAHGFIWGGATVWGGSFPWKRRDAMHWEFADLSRL